MLAVKCFVILCITYCQQLVADPDGGYKYSQPYPESIDQQCIENQNKSK